MQSGRYRGRSGASLPKPLPRLGDAGPKQIVNVDDADRPAVLDHEQRGDRRRVDQLQCGAGEEVGRGGLRFRRHDLGGALVEQPSAVPPAPTAVPKNADAPPRSRLSDCKGRGIATACGGGAIPGRGRRPSPRRTKCCRTCSGGRSRSSDQCRHVALHGPDHQPARRSGLQRKADIPVMLIRLGTRMPWMDGSAV